MSSGSYDSVNKDDDDEYGQGQNSYKQFGSPRKAADLSQQQSEQHEGGHMTPQPSVGRFTEKEKSTTMFCRKPPTPRTQESSLSSQSTSSGIVNLRAPTHAEDKMNKRKK